MPSPALDTLYVYFSAISHFIVEGSGDLDIVSLDTWMTLNTLIQQHIDHETGGVLH
mgnify:CR=1 FL=1|jgi:hypothetical protein